MGRNGRNGKPTVAKGTTGEIDRTAGPPVKTAVTLSPLAHYRLRAACVHRVMDQSALIELLIIEHLGGCFTSDRAAAPETLPAPGPTPTPPVSSRL